MLTSTTRDSVVRRSWLLGWSWTGFVEEVRTGWDAGDVRPWLLLSVPLQALQLVAAAILGLLAAAEGG